MTPNDPPVLHSAQRILFMLSGSIACFKACGVISRLAQSGHAIDVVASRWALKFVGEATLEGLTGRPVHSEVFAKGRLMEHIHLIHKADLVILCPATANTLNKLAAGIGSDMIGALSLAWDRRPEFHIFPAMNSAMYLHPATQASIARLKEWGYRVHSTGRGSLACGESGDGRLLEPDEILRLLADAGLRTPIETSNRLAVLVTSGGTTEPIDDVRAISNTSSGQTGAAIAEEFASAGHRVTFLTAKSGARPSAQVEEVPFVTAGELEKALRDRLGRQSFDIVIHAAAVADYTPETQKGKIDSSETLELRLKRNPKLIEGLRSWSRNSKIRIVGFKLTSGASQSELFEKVSDLARRANCDFVVGNDLSEINGLDKHIARVYRATQQPFEVSLAAQVDSKSALAFQLRQLLEVGP